MVLLGLLLVALSVIAILGAVFLLDSSGVEYFGADVPAVAVFVVGALTVVLIGVGIRLMTAGTKRNLRARRAQKQLDEQAAARDADPSDREPPR